jgi:hypothetical protein
VEEARAAFDKELQAQREDHSRKSSLARQLVKEKDTALQRVTAEVDELRSEVESGGHSERKIIQLAQAQATRDSEVKITVEAKDERLAVLEETVRQREAFIASRNEEFTKLAAEVVQLRRMAVSQLIE